MSNKKKVDEKAILSELSHSSYFSQEKTKDEEKAAENKVQSVAVDESIDLSVDSIIDQSVDRSIEQPASQLINQTTSRQSKRQVNRSAILGKPKAFYITKKQDKDLDLLVQKLSQELEGKINQKIDRSTVVRLILDASDPMDAQAVKRLAKQLVDQLVIQLVD